MPIISVAGREAPSENDVFVVVGVTSLTAARENSYNTSLVSLGQ